MWSFATVKTRRSSETMAYQICPNDKTWLVDTFTDVTSKPYGYLVLAHHPSTLEEKTVVTNILPGNQLNYYINSNAEVKRHQNFLMGNSQSKLKRKSNKLKVVKRTIKFVSVAPDFEVVRAIIKKAPNAVIGAISNWALNCRQGAVHIPPHFISLFRRHNKHFDYLVDRKKSTLTKRHLIRQKSGALPIIAPLLATVLGLIVGEFISRLMRKNNK